MEELRQKLQKFLEINENRVWLMDEGGSLVWYQLGSNEGWHPFWASGVENRDEANPYNPHTMDFEFVNLLATILNGIGTPEFKELINEK